MVSASRVVALVGMLVWGSGGLQAGTSPLTAKLAWANCIGRCSQRVRVHIEQSDADAKLKLLLDGPKSYYSEMPLNPYLPATTDIWYKDMREEGDYALTIELWRHDGGDVKAGTVTLRFHIGVPPEE